VVYFFNLANAYETLRIFHLNKILSGIIIHIQNFFSSATMIQHRVVVQTVLSNEERPAFLTDKSFAAR